MLRPTTRDGGPNLNVQFPPHLVFYFNHSQWRQTFEAPNTKMVTSMRISCFKTHIGLEDRDPLVCSMIDIGPVWTCRKTFRSNSDDINNFISFMCLRSGGMILYFLTTSQHQTTNNVKTNQQSTLPVHHKPSLCGILSNPTSTPLIFLQLSIIPAKDYTLPLSL